MTTTGESADPEAVIRSYLLYLEDPNHLRDEAEIEKAQMAVEEAADPIQRLKAIAELERVSNIEEAPLKAGFIQHAKAWAKDQGIPLSAFQQMNVPAEVLREAGFEVPTRRRGRGGAASTEGRQRAKAVPAEEIKAHILQREGKFLLTDITDSIGGSLATVRKAVDELIEAGQVQKLGTVADHQGPGRAPVEYSVTTPPQPPIS